MAMFGPGGAPPEQNRAAGIDPAGFETIGKTRQGSVDQINSKVQKWGRNTGALRGGARKSRRGRGV